MCGGSRLSLQHLEKDKRLLAGDISSITEGLLVTMVTVANRHWMVSLFDFYKRRTVFPFSKAFGDLISCYPTVLGMASCSCPRKPAQAPATSIPASKEEGSGRVEPALPVKIPLRSSIYISLSIFST